MKSSKSDQHTQYRQSLGSQVNTIEQEGRMVLPGIQALFGFQLIAVFNQGFKANLNENEQILHLVALLLVAVSAMLVMAPAAYHRQANHQISKHFVSMSSAFLAWAMVPLMLGTSVDIYLVAEVIIHSQLVSFLISLVIFALYTWTWFIFPHLRARKIEKLPVHEANAASSTSPS